MKGTPGVAARVFNAVAKKGINVIMISQGSSEVNISFAVKEKDGEEAVRAIHEEFGLSRR
jgi:aspartate kinase